MENKTLNSAESLELISRMIAETRGKLEKGGGTIFLIWGYTATIVAIAVFSLVSLTGNYLFQWLWWTIPTVGWSFMYFHLRNRQKSVKTYIDKFIGYIWLTIGIVAVALPVVGMFSAVANFMILPFEALIVSVGVVMTGLTIRFKTLTVCGFIALALSFLMTLVGGDWYIYIFIAMFIVGMIIPGHALNHQKRCSKN